MKRVIRIALGVISFAIVALVAYGFYLHALMDSVVERYHARRALAGVTPSELEAGVGHLGTVLRFRDGSWLAIRYRDCHAFPTWSLATAHDSSGSWYESSEHFCGAFSTIRHMESIDRALGETPPLLKDPPTDRGEWIRLLAACPDLPTARKHMKRYFHGVQ